MESARAGRYRAGGFESKHGKSCRGFDHSQMITRTTELNEIRGRETVKVNASYSSKLSPLAFLDGVQETRGSKSSIPSAVPGYIVPTSHTNRNERGQFYRSPGGNVTVVVHDGKRGNQAYLPNSLQAHVAGRNPFMRTRLMHVKEIRSATHHTKINFKAE